MGFSERDGYTRHDVWKLSQGDIPYGFVVFVLDGDNSNLVIENIACVPKVYFEEYVMGQYWVGGKYPPRELLMAVYENSVKRLKEADTLELEAKNLYRKVHEMRELTLGKYWKRKKPKLKKPDKKNVWKDRNRETVSRLKRKGVMGGGARTVKLKDPTPVVVTRKATRT